MLNSKSRQSVIIVLCVCAFAIHGRLLPAQEFKSVPAQREQQRSPSPTARYNTDLWTTTTTPTTTPITAPATTVAHGGSAAEYRTQRTEAAWPPASSLRPIPTVAATADRRASDPRSDTRSQVVQTSATVTSRRPAVTGNTGRSNENSVATGSPSLQSSRLPAAQRGGPAALHDGELREPRRLLTDDEPHGATDSALEGDHSELLLFPAALDPASILIKLLFGTTITVIASVVALRSARNWMGTNLAPSVSRGHLRVVETLSLPNRSALQLIQAGNRQLIVAIDQSGVKAVVPVIDPFDVTFDATQTDNEE